MGITFWLVGIGGGWRTERGQGPGRGLGFAVMELKNRSRGEGEGVGSSPPLLDSKLGLQAEPAFQTSPQNSRKTPSKGLKIAFKRPSKQNENE